MLKIILTGPESTGKTTLVKQLSRHFKASFIKEYARNYIDKLGVNYLEKDLLSIAKKQYTLEQKNQNLLFCDTDLITIKIWSLTKYKKCNSWILDKIEQQKIENRFYLLCKPDITWKADTQRENPNNRKELFQLYKNELERLAYPYAVVRGEERLQVAITKSSNYINNL